MLSKTKTVIDIFPHKLVAASVRASADKVEILKFREIELETGYYQQDFPGYEKQVLFVSRTLAKMKLDRKNAAVNVILDDVITRFVEVPTLSPRDLEKLVFNNIQDYLTINPDDYQVEHKVMATSKADGVSMDRVLLVAIPKALLQQLHLFFKACNIDVRTIDVFASSLSRLYEDFKHEVLGILVVDAVQSHFMILEKGQLFMHTTFSPSVSPFSNYLPANGNEHIQNQSISVDEVLTNVSSYLNFFSASRYGAFIDHLVVLGSEDLDAIGQMLAERFALRITIGLSSVVLQVSAPEGIQFSPTHHPALLGLALHSPKKRAELNFELPRLQDRRPKKEIAKRLVPYSSLLLLAVGAWVYYPTYEVHKNEQELSQLKSSASGYASVNQQEKDMAVFQSVYQQKSQFQKYIQDQDVPVKQYLDTIQSLLPQNVTISSITMKKGDINLSVNLQTPLQLAQLIQSFNQSGYFNEITSASVPLQGSYSYSMELKVIKPLPMTRGN